MNTYENYLGLGIAGNFALHLEQAGELEDFKDVVVADENGPKGVFPFYVPQKEGQLGVYPISSNTIILPTGEDAGANVQAEPELGIICDLAYDDAGKLSKITPTHFGAYNDCSIRKEGATKISQKKNWGEASKGFSEDLIAIDSFTSDGILKDYRICSFLRRDDMVMRYGEDVEINGYSFMYEKLLDWMQNQINTQLNSGPLEPILKYIKEANLPSKALISIGATRYTQYGEKTYLQSGDEVVIVVYDNTLYCKNPIMSMVVARNTKSIGVSALSLRVQ